MKVHQPTTSLAAKYDSPYEQGRAAVIRTLIPPATACGRALDAGSGTGFYSQILRAAGWTVTAIDADESKVRDARPHVDTAIVGRLPAALHGLVGASFDLVLALEIIGHMDEPTGHQLLAELRRLTRPGGRLVVSTPNRWSLEGLGEYYWGECLRGWERWTAWDPSHVRIYNSRELMKMLRQTGWRVERFVGYWYSGRLPLNVKVTLPFRVASAYPLNRFGFNMVARCRAGASTSATTQRPARSVACHVRSV